MEHFKQCALTAFAQKSTYWCIFINGMLIVWPHYGRAGKFPDIPVQHPPKHTVLGGN